MEKISCSRALELLRDRELTDLPSLKFAGMLGDKADYWITGSQDPLVAVSFPPEHILYDQADYPQARLIHLLAGGSVQDALDYLADQPRGTHIVKSSRLAKSDFGTLQTCLRRTYLSYTCDKPLPARRGTVIEEPRSPDRESLDLLKQLHYSKKDVDEILDRGGRLLLAKKGNETAACCFLSPNYGNIWEIGGVVTLAGFQRQGLASALVARGVEYLQDRGHFIRYQMDENNRASVALAEKMGFRLFLTYRHWEITIP